MKIQFTGMLDSAIPPFYLSVFERLTKTLSNALADRNYGNLDEITFMAVAIDETLDENEIRALKISKFTKYTHPFTKQRFRALFVALPFARPDFASMSERIMLKVLCDAAIHIVSNLPLKIPKDVDYMRLRCDLVEAMKIQQKLD
jgi:hypothetical protein